MRPNRHEHDYRPIGDGVGAFKVPREPEPPVPDEGLSLQAVFANAVLAANRHLDDAEQMALVTLERAGTPEIVRKNILTHVRLAEGYARLAQALQYGAPGQRF